MALIEHPSSQHHEFPNSLVKIEAANIIFGLLFQICSLLDLCSAHFITSTCPKLEYLELTEKRADPMVHVVLSKIPELGTHQRTCGATGTVLSAM